MSDRMEILNKIESGEISPEEGARLLEGINIAENSDPNPPASQFDILTKIELGEISPEEGAEQLLNMPDQEESEFLDDDETNYSMQGSNENEDDDEEPELNFSQSKSNPISDEELSKWKKIWLYPLYIGLTLTVLAGAWMNGSYQANQGIGFWFLCATMPFALGLLLMAISWNSQNGPWIHVRIKEKNSRVAISIPMFIKISGGFIRTFGKFIPHMSKNSLSDLADAVEATFSPENPLEVNVSDGDDGEEVKIYIG